MPLYDFFCKECKILVEDEFFKIADEKDVKCKECGSSKFYVRVGKYLCDECGVMQ